MGGMERAWGFEMVWVATTEVRWEQGFDCADLI